jgi:hypothetical protein
MLVSVITAEFSIHLLTISVQLFVLKMFILYLLMNIIYRDS